MPADAAQPLRLPPVLVDVPNRLLSLLRGDDKQAALVAAVFDPDSVPGHYIRQRMDEALLQVVEAVDVGPADSGPQRDNDRTPPRAHR